MFKLNNPYMRKNRFLDLIHFWSISKLYSFHLGRGFHCISDTMMVVLLILLGKGWTVTRYFVVLFIILNLDDIGCLPYTFWNRVFFLYLKSLKWNFFFLTKLPQVTSF